MKNNTQTIARKIFILCSLFFALVANAQAPENIGYQAVIRNASNALVANANVGIRISILQGTATGTAVFSQTQSATTNANGLASITFGVGGFSTGDFAAINWGNGPYFIKTETDPTGGTNYTITSTTQLMSVPYALYAKSSGSVANNNAWGLGGNTGTNVNNFIGTIDDNDVIFKRNSIKSGILGNTNTGFGMYMLNSNTTGINNTANGYQSLYSNTTGNANTAIGFTALAFNNTGFFNTANGHQALYSNTIGENNTSFGKEALYSNISGNSNTALGNYALHENTTANYNVAVGRDALYNITTGGYNTAIGYRAGFNLSNGTVYNTTSIGYLSGQSSQTSNHITIGNGAVTSIGGIVGWTNFSDKRMKTNIQENVPGLNFIKLLKPVTYNFDATKQFALTHKGKKDDTPDYPNKKDIEKIKFSGFLAQDVEAAAKSIGYDFSGVDAPKDANGIYGLRYAEFVVPMVKAIQEQQAIIEKLEAKIKELENKK
jgi:hypothetical protein